MPKSVASETAADISRARSAALASVRDPSFGSPLGLLHYAGQISAAQLAAGKRWLALSTTYSTACRSPLAPRTVPLDRAGGTPIDPDSAQGVAEAGRHRRTIANYLEAAAALKRAGLEAATAVRNIVEYGLAPISTAEISALKAGLGALAAYWLQRRG